MNLTLRLCLPAMLALSACSSPDIPRMPGPPSSALTVAGIRADSDQRFNALLEGATDNTIITNYATDRPSTWGKNFTRRLDFTGVAWDDTRTATAVSPLHVVMAAHYQRPVGSKVVFHDRGGRPHQRTLVAVESLTGIADVAVGKLDAPLPSGVKPYRVLPPSGDYGSLAGCLAIVTDQQRRAFVHEIYSIQNGSLAFSHANRLSPLVRKNLVTGDSGHPSFLLVGGEMVLIGTHTFGGPGKGPFYSSPAVYRGVNAAMAKLGGGYQLGTVPLAL
ncbi:hypothetical protein OKA04_22250 [Luteolibacter flavescens]|uniref:Serine protease n=1 Tax=Luteolibacter flavescens TaxID=1859460 RepID=A0ABT3FVX7_9BACT|nr:hypothetical protein [Luteolibacter flavescens]MCW1887474.1 hypothetical protein [Luteolibacter flavescens]